MSHRVLALYDAECTICRTAAATSRRCENSVRWVPAGPGEAPDSIRVVDAAGKELQRSAAVAAIIGEWRLIGPTAAKLMRRFETPLDAVYDAVARNRHALGAPLRIVARLRR